MKIKKQNFKSVQIILRLIKAFSGAIGATFVITDYKWTGLIIIAVGAIANEGLAIIKEEEEENEEVNDNASNTSQL